MAYCNRYHKLNLASQLIQYTIQTHPIELHKGPVLMSFQFPIRIYIEDTDAGGIVYHANHVRFMERARSEWLRAAGISHYWQQHDYSFVVHKIKLKYQRAIIMDDLIHVTVNVISCKATSFILKQEIYRGEILLASGEVELACLNPNMRPRKLPNEIRDLLIRHLI